ncbi:glutamate--tRNA ligase [Amygdalobacter nucleatus]|uniref:glutamate--tRNA ligase n=1 Tax=Amygdalobacter nucleatus TaxID=3029274 RepID=UPI0027A74C86|nr:glutamate--tRNA ligase [Amygdalobacter nucleatus]WEG36970.1 glutamate--tRNA ligase [Amygdalobacter nucleatus]
MQEVRTRFAPSPTGFMHIGNLRTALFEYLVAKSNDGKFILRIEDTDQKRKVEGALEKIYNTLESVGMDYDEGPDKPGEVGPYVQSERLNMYLPEALKLVESGHAYYCFCSEERLAKLHEELAAKGASFIGYDRHCRNLSAEEVKAKLQAGEPYVIRQKMPDTGETTYHDEVYGDITVQNNTLEDQVLVKSDGYPTYNFANVVDDHSMQITHVVRGCEYLSSTPKYVLLYEAFGYKQPKYIHLPLINGPDGKKLSKRHGATSYEELIQQGFLPEAVINYLALLGWSPASTTELFTLQELEQAFDIAHIAKAPAVFDIEKLKWFNAQYIQKKTVDEFYALIQPELKQLTEGQSELAERLQANSELLARILQPRLNVITEVTDKLSFLPALPNYSNDLFVHKKMKTTLESSLEILHAVLPEFEQLDSWTEAALHGVMINYATSHELKNGKVMWPVRVAATGLQVSPGGASEALVLLGKQESLKRLEQAIEQLKAELAEA